MIITYNGSSNVREIVASDFTAVGLTSPTLRWEKSNGFSIDVPPDVGAFLLAQGEFYAEPATVFGDVIEGGIPDLETLTSILNGTYVATTGAETVAGAKTFSESVTTGKNLVLPASTSALGQIVQNAQVVFHTLGTNNLFVGDRAGNLTFTGQGNNVGLGYLSLRSLTTGRFNTGVGIQTLLSCSTGEYNVAIGATAGQNITTGYANTIVGVTGAAVTTGQENTLIGENAGQLLTTGHKNVALGSRSLAKLVGGGSNVGLGRSTLTEKVSNDYCIGIGHFAGGYDLTSYSAIYIGNAAGNHETDTANAATAGDHCGFIGEYAGPNVPGNLSNAWAIGSYAKVDISNAMVLGASALGSAGAHTPGGNYYVKIGIGIAAPLAKLHVRQEVEALGDPVSIFQGASGQSADLARWQIGTAAPLARITAAGYLNVGGGAAAVPFSVGGSADGAGFEVSYGGATVNLSSYNRTTDAYGALAFNAAVIQSNAPYTTTMGAGFWNHAAPGSQPAVPVTLGDVIAVLQAYGLSA